MIIYFDTETTGIRPGQIAQLSYLMQDETGVRAKNFFFTVDSMDYGAFMVHGFSKEKLFELSNGKRFIHFIDEIESDFSSADLICAHNTSFDFMFMRAEFERLNRVFTVKNEFCSMKKLTPVCKLIRNSGGYKYPKLNEACAYFGITDDDLRCATGKLFSNQSGYHDARFDTTGVCLLMNKIMALPNFAFIKEYL